MKLLRRYALITLSAGLLATPAWSADERTEMAIESREGIFEVIRMYFGPIYGMVQGQIPFNAEVVSGNADKIAQLAEMIPDGFRFNTAGSDAPTEALDAIWDNIEDFNEKAATLATRAQALSAAADGGLDDTRKAFGAMGQACKACHDNYREQD